MATWFAPRPPTTAGRTFALRFGVLTRTGAAQCLPLSCDVKSQTLVLPLPAVVGRPLDDREAGREVVVRQVDLAVLATREPLAVVLRALLVGVRDAAAVVLGGQRVARGERLALVLRDADVGGRGLEVGDVHG